MSELEPGFRRMMDSPTEFAMAYGAANAYGSYVQARLDVNCWPQGRSSMHSTDISSVGPRLLYGHRP